MRRLASIGVFSMASVLAGACTDDGNTSTGVGGGGGTGGSSGTTGGSSGAAGVGGDAGTGGTLNVGGTAGMSNAGSAGMGGMGTSGSAGTAGTSGAGGGSGSGNDPDAGDAGIVEGDSGVVADAGDAGAPPPCTGCLELRGPLGAPNDSAYFQLVFASDDLSDTVAIFRVRVLVFDESGQTIIQPFATDADFTQGNGASVLNNAATFIDTDTFVDVPLNIGAIATAGFDDTQVVAFGIQFFAGGSFAGPPPVILLDSVTFTGTAGLSNLDFTNDEQGFAVLAGLSVAGTAILHH